MVKKQMQSYEIFLKNYEQASKDPRERRMKFS
jgi:hypothetical protein